MAEEVDVVIIGAGFAGLAAARQLARTGLDVLVLEGRDRVGGRSWTQATAGIPLDLGATFVGPGQDAVLELARELGVDEKLIREAVAVAKEVRAGADKHMDEFIDRRLSGGEPHA